MKICAVRRFILKPCDFIRNLLNFMLISSVMVSDVRHFMKSMYDIDSVFDNDGDALISRILFVQKHEEQMRVSW